MRQERERGRPTRSGRSACFRKSENGRERAQAMPSAQFTPALFSLPLRAGTEWMARAEMNSTDV